MPISIIAAVDKNLGIGYQQKLPWHFPEDLAIFKSLTFGHGLILGRKTFDSLGRVLVNREHFIVSRQKQLCVPEQCFLHNSIESAIQHCQSRHQHCFIIGGADIFELGFQYANTIYLTEIQQAFEVDTYLPQIPDNFKLKHEYQIAEHLIFKVLTNLKALTFI